MGIPAILQQLGRSNMAQLAQPVRQMMSMVRTAQNPQLMLNQIVMNNPQMRQVMDLVQKHGGDPMTALRKEAEAAGISPEEILGMLKCRRAK